MSNKNGSSNWQLMDEIQSIMQGSKPSTTKASKPTDQLNLSQQENVINPQNLKTYQIQPSSTKLR